MVMSGRNNDGNNDDDNDDSNDGHDSLTIQQISYDCEETYGIQMCRGRDGAVSKHQWPTFDILNVLLHFEAVKL
jgi:hypothetical protein